MFDVKVFTSTTTGAQQLVEHTRRSTWLGAADLRGILKMQYPPHAFVITIEEVAAQRER